MNQDIGFYNKYLVNNNSYLRRYLINNIIKYSIDNNIKKKKLE